MWHKPALENKYKKKFPNIPLPSILKESFHIVDDKLPSYHRRVLFIRGGIGCS